MDLNQAIPEDEFVDAGLVAPEQTVEQAVEQPPIEPIGPSNAEIKALAEAEELAQPARGFEVNQPAQVAAPKLEKPRPTFIDLGGGDRIVSNEDGSVTLQPAPPPAVPDTKVELSPRAMTKREAELEAGRKAVARHEEMERNRPKPAKTQQEIAAEGRSTPVFRPGEFREYRDLKVAHPSKDAGGAGAKVSIPEPNALDIAAAARAAGPSSY